MIFANSLPGFKPFLGTAAEGCSDFGHVVAFVAFVKNQLNGEVEALGKPRAALLMMCLAVVAANALAVLRKAPRASHGLEPEDLSGYYLADELGGTTGRWACCWHRPVGRR